MSFAIIFFSPGILSKGNRASYGCGIMHRPHIPRILIERSASCFCSTYPSYQCSVWKSDNLRIIAVAWNMLSRIRRCCVGNGTRGARSGGYRRNSAGLCPRRRAARHAVRPAFRIRTYLQKRRVRFPLILASQCKRRFVYNISNERSIAYAPQFQTKFRSNASI